MYLTHCQILLEDQRWNLTSGHLPEFHKVLKQLIKLGSKNATLLPSMFFNKHMECNMYLLTEWEGRTGKYLARGRGVRTERSEVRTS